jgi:energy-converting hydrogenase Eha subunit C
VCGIDRFIENGVTLSFVNRLNFNGVSLLWSSLQDLASANSDAWGLLSFVTSWLGDLPWPLSTLQTGLVDLAVIIEQAVAPIGSQLGTEFYINQSGLAWTAGLTDWTGSLDSGESTTSSARLSGSSWPAVAISTIPALTSNSSYVPLVATTCDLLVSVLPHQPFSVTVQLPNVQAVLQSVMSQAKAVASCRQPGLDLAGFHSLYDPVSAELWLNLLTVAQGYTTFQPFGTAADSLMTPALKLYNLLNLPPLQMPSTCSYATFNSTGECSGEYTGFDSLFGGLDLTLRWTVQRCSAYPDALPSFNLQCVGSACASFFAPSQLQPCQQDADCSDGSTCTVLSSFLVGSPFNSLLFNQMDLTCDNGNMDTFAVFTYLLDFMGLTTPPLTIVNTESPSIGYCSLVFQNDITTDTSGWAQEAATLTNSTTTLNSTVTLTGLSAYNPFAAGGNTGGLPSVSTAASSSISSTGSTTGGSTSSPAAASSTAPAQPVLPPESQEVTFQVEAPTNVSTATFESTLTLDVAVNIADDFPGSLNISAAEVVPYVIVIGLTPSSGRRLLQVLSSFSFYVLGSISDLAPATYFDLASAATLTKSLATAIANGTFVTPHSQAQVPRNQTVQITTVQQQTNGAAAATLYTLPIASIVAVATAVLSTILVS